jgi:hypothetical protein
MTTLFSGKIKKNAVVSVIASMTAQQSFIKEYVYWFDPADLFREIALRIFIHGSVYRSM